MQGAGIEIEIIRSKRKSIALEIKPDLRVIVRAPLAMSQKDIERFVASKEQWLKKNISVLLKKQCCSADVDVFSEDELKELTLQAQKNLPLIADYYTALIGVKYNKITVRKQKTRWGSCTSNGNLSFNCLLMLCPEQVQKYVVIHELCHIKEMNHSPAFWANVEAVCPDYKKQKLWLKQNGAALIRRLTK